MIMSEIKKHTQERGICATLLCDALHIPRANYYRKNNIKKPPKEPANKLSSDEIKNIIDILHSERFYDQTAYQVFYTLLDEGYYYCSIRTMYRLLSERGETQERRIVRNHRDAIKPELLAVRSNEVWSWDITKLLSTRRLTYYYLYVIMDIYSRYVVGWILADKECQHLAKKLIQTSAIKQGIQPGKLILHSDNGPSMTSGTVAQLLEHLGVEKSHNRPYTSNDNPYSESQFKTMKYCPEFPNKFESFDEAETFCQYFFEQYNTQHFHSGISYLTPETVHFNQADKVLNARWKTLMAAYELAPHRFNGKPPTKKIIRPAYINPPQTVQINDGQKEVNMA